MATERHRGAILAVRISFGVFAGLLCLGQISFAAVALLIFAQATAPPPIPQPHMIPVFLTISLLWLLVAMPFFFWLQWFLPRRFRKRGSSYGKVTTVYIIAKLLAIGAAEGLGFLGLVTCLILQRPWPFMILSILSIALIAGNIPRARVLREMDAASF